MLAELIGDAGFRIAPLDRRRRRGARRTAARPAGSSRGFRGAPPADAGALVDLVHRLARLAEDAPEVAELDLNPVLALPDGCVAVDARVRLRHPSAQPQTEELVAAGFRTFPQAGVRRSPDAIPPGARRGFGA